MPSLSRVAIGAIALPLALLPTSAFADATAPPTGSSTSTATPTTTSTATPTTTSTATPTTTSTATATATSTATATATSTATATATRTPSPTTSRPTEPLFGTFVTHPSSGAPGTTITVTSVTTCVDRRGVVGKGAVAVLTDAADTNGEADPADASFVSTDRHGGWQAQLTVPKSATMGQAFEITAGCLYTDPKVVMPTETDLFQFYGPAPFTVTAASTGTTAPGTTVATPVTQNPTFTG